MEHQGNKTRLSVFFEGSPGPQTENPAWQRFTESSPPGVCLNPSFDLSLCLKSKGEVWAAGQIMREQQRNGEWKETKHWKKSQDLASRKVLIQVSHICLLPRAKILESPTPSSSPCHTHTDLLYAAAHLAVILFLLLSFLLRLLYLFIFLYFASHPCYSIIYIASNINLQDRVKTFSSPVIDKHNNMRTCGQSDS